MIKTICLFSCLGLAIGLSDATVQIKDGIRELSDQGKVVLKSHISEAPLSSVLSDKGIENSSMCSANWSGYTADWLIQGGKFYLENYYSGYRNLDRREIEANSQMKKLFPKSDGAVFAEWYSGVLDCGSGKRKLRAISGHIVLYEYLYVYEIDHGIVKAKTIYKYPENIDYYNKKLSKKYGRKIDLLKEGEK